jgi:hypothetical protein
VDGQRLRVADVGDVADEAERVDEASPRLRPALDSEADQGAGAVRQVPPRPLDLGARLEAGIADPPDAGVLLEVRAIRSALSECRAIRRWSVSRPCRRRKALNGESAGPRSRSNVTRALIA